MTQREAQILRWIQEDPLISQQELADRAGIARSSVAVHISNLMKKGCIEGKGYIVRTAPYVVVVGGIRVDIGGRPHRGLDPHTVNAGQIRTSLGGAGRNIAHDLRQLGVDVRMITALAEDVYARRIHHSCTALGIDLSHSVKVPEAVTASRVYITDAQGHPELAVSDREILDHITPEWLSAHQYLLDGAQLVVMDADLPEASIQWLARHVRVPLYADPADLSRAELLKPVLGRLHTVKTSLAEAQLLSSVAIHDRASLDQAADVLLSTGLKRLLITLGPHGIYAADQTECCLLPPSQGVTVSTNGCGDAAVAGMVWAHLEGCTLEESVRAARAAAAITRESPHTISPDLTPDFLRQLTFS